MNGLTQSVTVDRKARLLAFGALIAAALMLSLPAFSTSARAAESDPTIVLVHGAFASPAGWDGVADALHKDGYQTATPALGLTSVSGDVATVRSTLDSIPGDKILVGHSYGGFVTTNAASGRSDVRGLVYTAAYVPDSGETINNLNVGYAPGAFLTHLVFAPLFPFVIVDPHFFPADFAQDLNPKLAAEIAAAQRPTSLGLFVTASGRAAWPALPSWYAVSGHDRAIDPALQRFMAQRAGSTTVQFADASHIGGLTHYRARFVKLIERAIDATAPDAGQDETESRPGP
ncbi:MAG TPA: alpha/beta hydrolase [Microbacteriaceae bacterium]|jgi:pimeloyl-ACP methyl ester carboxylesterase|nr:alpha/beta hydrolase [Microbacteriaceae bacterium]